MQCRAVTSGTLLCQERFIYLLQRKSRLCNGASPIAQGLPSFHSPLPLMPCIPELRAEGSLLRGFELSRSQSSVVIPATAVGRAASLRSTASSLLRSLKRNFQDQADSGPVIRHALYVPRR